VLSASPNSGIASASFRSLLKFTMSGAHGHLDGSNKRIALMIAIFALLLAIAETMAKSAQTDADDKHVRWSELLI
jgi:hypothetical protein